MFPIISLFYLLSLFIPLSVSEESKTLRINVVAFREATLLYAIPVSGNYTLNLDFNIDKFSVDNLDYVNTILALRFLYVFLIEHISNNNFPPPAVAYYPFTNYRLNISYPERWINEGMGIYIKYDISVNVTNFFDPRILKNTSGGSLKAPKNITIDYELDVRLKVNKYDVNKLSHLSYEKIN